MNRCVLCMLCILCWGALAAQPRIEAVQEGLGGYTTTLLLQEKGTPGTLTVYLTLLKLENCDTPLGTTRHEVRSTGQRLLTLRPADESYGVGYHYSWQYVQGKVDPRVDTTFVYRMPVSVKKPVRGIHIVDAVDKLKGKPTEQQRWLGWHFALEKGDTVYAMRRGVVTRIEKPEPSELDTLSVSYTSRSTNIYVEHADGSIARYVCLDSGNLLVRAGDEVLPSTPLALAGTYDGAHYKVIVNTFWYTKCSPTEDRPNEITALRYFNPRFATAAGDLQLNHWQSYTPVLSREMLTREMSKKELKCFQEKPGE